MTGGTGSTDEVCHDHRITIRVAAKKAQGCKRGKPNAEKKKLLDRYIPATWNYESCKKRVINLKFQSINGLK